MTYSAEQIVKDLAPFADLGAPLPEAISREGEHVLRIFRDGKSLELTFLRDGKILERCEGRGRTHLSMRALLASEPFAYLKRWADNQRLLLKSRVASESIPVTGVLASDGSHGGVDRISSVLDRSSYPDARSSIILLDGPAGIGKTSTIRALCLRRAESFLVDRLALVLHVESRGRMLQNITDLMAYSLQSLRVSVTYDQVPPLVRHGLICLALDGFDELADPNGYELAWAQVNDLLVECRGDGSIILAGRETFIRKQRLLKALPGLDPAVDNVDVFTLQPLAPEIARNWIRTQGWPEHLITSAIAEPIFEKKSYALTPFFLSQLSSKDVAAQLEASAPNDLLPFLVEAMVTREASKFGAEVEAVSSADQRKTFVVHLVEEVARDIADNQTDAISVDMLSWLAEMSVAGFLPPSVTNILRNRAEVIAFLTNDERQGYRRFVHETLSNYFLARVTIRSIVAGEVPKYLRRNIFGLDFLMHFSEVARGTSEKEIRAFICAASDRITALSDQDRARRNLAALLIATLGVVSTETKPELANVSIDEAYLGETSFPITLVNVTIGQLEARECDMRAVVFDGDSYIGTLIADLGTTPSATMPIPSIIDLPDQVLTEHDEKLAWLHRQYEHSLSQAGSIWDHSNELELFALMRRLARYKPFWLKGGDERAARKIVDDENWETLKDMLLKHDLLVERRDIPASGRSATFWHLRNRQDFLEPTPPDHLMPFLRELFRENLTKLYKSGAFDRADNA